MARRTALPAVLVACGLACCLVHVGCLLFTNVASAGGLRSSVAVRAVVEPREEEGLVKLKPEESSTIASMPRDKNNNPPRYVVKTNDPGQPEIEYSTGATNEVAYITPVVESEDIKAWLSLNVNFFAGITLFTTGGLIEIQRFFPDTLYW
mmetsp:Transcript_31827/g.59854  ORF Transcript_31827/g.59854 Transcript_31827/m.59854 type:complete len:150 (+) Transcript_31827:79-528(+)